MALLFVLFAMAPPAQGAVVTDRPLLFTFGGADSSAGRFERPTSVAVDNASGALYVGWDMRGNYPGFVCKFTADGVAAAFSATASSCLTGADGKTFTNGLGVAVDNSAVNPSRLYVSEFGGERLSAFAASGGFLWSFLTTPPPPRSFFQGEDVAVDPAGHPWVVASNGVCEYDSSGTPPTRLGCAFLPGLGDSIDFDASGNAYVRRLGQIQRFAGGNFAAEPTTLDPSGSDVYANQSTTLPTPATAGHIFTAVAQRNERQSVRVSATAGQFKLSFGGEASGDIPFDAPGSEAETEAIDSVQEALEALPAIGAGNVSVFGGPGNEGGTKPYVVDFKGSLAKTDIPQLLCEDGTTPLGGGTGCRVSTVTNGTRSDFQEYDAAGTLLGSYGTSYMLEGGGLPSVAYHPAEDRVYLSMAGDGETKPVVAVFGPERTGTVPDLTIDPPEDLRASCATFTGTVNPQATESTWHFEAKRPTETWASAAHYRSSPDQPLPADSEPHEVSYDTCALQGNSTFEVRLVGVNTENDLRGFSAVETFTTPIPDPPLATLTEITDITTSTAHIEGTVDPNEDTAEWQLETQASCEGAWSVAKPLPPDVYFTGTPGPQPVAYDLSGLLPAERYCARIEATNGGGSAYSNTEEFETEAIPPSEAELSFVAPRLDTSAWLNARINPEGAPLTYSFKYSADGGAHWQETPTAEDASEARGQVLVYQQITGLQPNTTYLYYLASAGNEAGPVPGLPGEVRSFTTRTSSEASLPQERGIELVNSPDKGTQNVAPGAGGGGSYPLDPVAANGDQMLWALTAGAPGANTAIGDTFLAERTGQTETAPNGWQSQSIVPPPDEQLGKGRFGYWLMGATPDFSRFVFQTGELDIAFTRGEQAFVRTGRGQGEEVLMGHPGASLLGVGETSEDGNHFLFLNSEKQLVDNGTPGKEELLSIVPKETEAGWTESECGLSAGSSWPGGPTSDAIGVSYRSGYSLIARKDASRVYFQVQRNGDCGGLYALWLRNREANKGAGRTIMVDPGSLDHDPEMIRASADGREAYFVTHSNRATYEALSAEEKKFSGKIDPEGIDQNSHADVYRWEESKNQSVCLTCKLEDEAGDKIEDVDITPHKAVIVSADFSHIYFQSKAQLVPGQGSAGHNNIYVASGGELRFVASVPDALSERLGGTVGGPNGEASADGNVLLFSSSEGARGLTADQVAAKCPELEERGVLSACNELYLYDDLSRGLECLTCLHGGLTTRSWRSQSFSQGLGGSITGFALSEDGSTVAFPTAQALVPRDVNNDTDIYEWRNGVTRLITDGVSDFAEGQSSPAVAAIDEDGSDLFFAAAAPGLTGYEHDELRNLYDARIGGGFPRPAPVAHCSEDSCQGPLQGAPSLDQPGTSGSSRGNVSEAAGCSSVGRSAARLARRARVLRRQAKRASRRAARQIHAKAARLTRRAQRLGEHAKRCRRANRKGTK